MFLLLSILHKIPWKYTVLFFSRVISILSASVVLYAIAGLRDFRPSIFGKVNTFAQVAAVFFVMLFELDRSRWVWITRTTFLHGTLAFTIVSDLHYVFAAGQRLLAHSETPAKSAARQRAEFDRASFIPLELMILSAVLISPFRCASITQCLPRP